VCPGTKTTDQSKTYARVVRVESVVRRRASVVARVIHPSPIVGARVENGADVAIARTSRAQMNKME